MEQHQLISSSTHFFKVLMFDFHQKLRLPPAFCVKVTDQKFKWAKLKSRRGTWKVKLSRDEEGGICFGEVGWPEFVDSHSLSVGDFLVFEHLGRFEFNVLVFDPTCCEKEFPVLQHNEDHPHRSERANISEESAHFTTTMQPLHALPNGHLNIPLDFIRSNNLENKTSADVKDEHGQVWTMNLVTQTAGQFRMHMGRGWLNFYRSKELKDGDVCVFYLSSNSPSSPSVSFDVIIS